MTKHGFYNVTKYVSILADGCDSPKGIELLCLTFSNLLSAVDGQAMMDAKAELALQQAAQSLMDAMDRVAALKLGQ